MAVISVDTLRSLSRYRPSITLPEFDQ